MNSQQPRAEPVDATDEIARGERFTFGENWARFLRVLNDDRIRQAEQSLANMLGMQTLDHLTFLDVGSGSGLFSLAAKRLGAATVRSFDYDPASVECTRELRRRYFPDDPAWIIERGSVLDRSYINALGRFDIVYSWGVLHHTGSMWNALENVSSLVTPRGLVFIAIYNDQGKASRVWTKVKRTYNAVPGPIKFIMLVVTFVALWGPKFLIDAIRGAPLRSWREYFRNRGMSPWHDVVDWLGGYPFEVAKPEAIFDFFRSRGFSLTRLITCGGRLGCNQFVFQRVE